MSVTVDSFAPEKPVCVPGESNALRVIAHRDGAQTLTGVLVDAATGEQAASCTVVVTPNVVTVTADPEKEADLLVTLRDQDGIPVLLTEDLDSPGRFVFVCPEHSHSEPHEH